MTKGMTGATNAARPDVENQRDRYGGWKATRFKATGFFRLEKDNRWWLVTPEGHAFLSFGINHIHTEWWNAPYNSAHWMREFGAQSLDDPAFGRGLRKRLMHDLKDFGFNTLGIHCDRKVLNRPEPFMPYIQRYLIVETPHWREPDEQKFLDVFAPTFERHCDDVARRTAGRLRDDPLLLGYAMTDCPILTDWDAKERGDTVYGAPRKALPTWPRVLRNLPHDRPGKQAYVATVRALYRDSIEAFNEAYSTTFSSFDALAMAENWRPYTEVSNGHELRDNTEFLKNVVDRYYSVAYDALRRYDSNHLFFGDKLNGNTDAADTVVGVTSKYTDVIFHQTYGRHPMQHASLDRWSARTGKPLFNGDSGYAVATEMMPRPCGPIAESQEERAAWVTEFAEQMFGRPDFVGWSFCGYIDSWKTHSPLEALRQHTGLITPTGERHELMQHTLRDIAERLYEIGTAAL